MSAIFATDVTEICRQPGHGRRRARIAPPCRTCRNRRHCHCSILAHARAACLERCRRHESKCLQPGHGCLREGTAPPCRTCRHSKREGTASSYACAHAGRELHLGCPRAGSPCAPLSILKCCVGPAASQLLQGGHLLPARLAANRISGVPSAFIGPEGLLLTRQQAEPPPPPSTPRE